ncbi:MAG: exodeoxyribonuclease V subunit gamma, partial [Enterobacteriaceae bacterium]
MFTLYHSNKLDLLKSIIAALIEREPASDPFVHDVILVQSPGMAQWLQIELAKHFGIAANIDFPLPATFIWQMFTTVLPGIPKESAFSKDAMTWKLMCLLPQLLCREAFAPLHHYLQDEDQGRKLYQLAARIADLFDQYLVYRPHWLESWQQQTLIEGLGEAQQWQAQLWDELQNYTRELAEPLWHRANLYQHFIRTLEESETAPPGLPQRVFICGISALPPVYLQALQALGRHCDIHLMFTNPCRFYWGDIQDPSFLAKLQARKRRHYWSQHESALLHGSQEMDDQVGQPLLASWGKLGRDNLSLLTQMTEVAEIDAFVEGERQTLLQRVQDDILQLQDRSVVGRPQEQQLSGAGKQCLDRKDNSLTFHLCHSVQREVEILHDHLLALFEQDPSLTARDVIVMVADIDSYTPFIQAVFANAPPERYLPFAISDRRISEAHPVLQGFITLLMLPESRFTAEEILALLEIPALAARFEIDESGLRQLRLWVEQSGIRWGLDDETVQALQLPATGQHTWRFGLTRMLLGYAMESDSGSWLEVLPYDGCSGLIATLVGQLAELLMQLTYWREQLAQPRQLGQWQPLCQQLLAAFFKGDSETQDALTLIEQQWQKVIQYGLAAQYPDAVSLVVLRDELAARLEQQRISQRFLAGPINFCTLMPMRSIPFKVVCLLGMNDGVYPRVLPPAGFDLMVDNVQKGDRSRRDDDRYLFLEALLSAQQRFYISYIARAVQDNHERYPSVLVTELLEYIEQSHYLPGDEEQDSDSSGQRVRQHLLQLHSRVPFSPENYQPGSAQQSFAAEWLPAAAGRGKAQGPFISQPLPELTLMELSLEPLYAFFRHPIRAFFQQRLNIFFQQEEWELESEEPFVLEGLSRYRCRLELLESLIAGEQGERVWQRQKAAGVLPHGAFAQISWQQMMEQVQPLAQEILQQRLDEQNLEVDLTVAGIRLYGWLNRVQS